MQTKLIKLKEGYIIISDKELSEGEDYWYKNGDSWHGAAYRKGYYNVFFPYGKSIIASTFISKLPNIDFNGLEEEFGIINVEKLANISANEIWNDEHTLENEQRELNGHMLGYVEGFNKCSILDILCYIFYKVVILIGMRDNFIKI